MEAKAILGVRVSPAIKEQLAEVAKAQHRTSSNLVEWLIKQYLEQISKRSTANAPQSAVLDFVTQDDLHSVLANRRPAIADTLRYLEDK